MTDGWTQRRLCPDGACIGVVGSDGRCGTCGTEDTEFIPGLAAADDIEPPPEEDEDVAAAPDPVVEADDGAGADDWSKRRLCSDGACTGVLDAHDKCQVCGRVDVAYHHDLD